MVHIDIVGLLPPSHRFTYILTCMDRFTRWPEAILIANIMAETVARVFVAIKLDNIIWRSFDTLN